MAMAGLHPVVAIYSTFLNRAFDQVLLDVALHDCGVTFVLDRAGITGGDDPRHNGMWDMSLLQIVPQVRRAAPRDAEQLRELLRDAVAVSDAPTAVRYAKGSLPEPLDAVSRHGTVDVLDSDDDPDVLIVAVGALAHTGMDAAAGLRAAGIGVRVVDPRWVKPLDPVLDEWSRRSRLVITIEDNGRAGGVGAALTARLQDRDITTPVTVHAVPQEFLDHAKRADILDRVGLTADAIVHKALATLEGLAAVSGAQTAQTATRPSGESSTPSER